MMKSSTFVFTTRNSTKILFKLVCGLISMLKQILLVPKLIEISMMVWWSTFCRIASQWCRAQEQVLSRRWLFYWMSRGDCDVSTQLRKNISWFGTADIQPKFWLNFSVDSSSYSRKRHKLEKKEIVLSARREVRVFGGLLVLIQAIAILFQGCLPFQIRALIRELLLANCRRKRRQEGEIVIFRGLERKNDSVNGAFRWG